MYAYKVAVHAKIFFKGFPNENGERYVDVNKTLFNVIFIMPIVPILINGIACRRTTLNNISIKFPSWLKSFLIRQYSCI